ncbi:MAG: DUF6174 domain-containing protein [Chloroflexota bacterium]|nr:DUF6174 domain-containing protein [Chloroflexota bacterium]MDE2941124.1 DUF6174 domain-containing protein [Chloroflexota bacterium]MDE3267350.1 DUF6174 domain-containing protein [Chloroflexota bacterium]
MRLYHAVVISALVGMFFASVLACTTAEPDAIAEPDAMLAHAQDELNRHRTLWVQTSARNYTYEYNVLCECPDHLGQTVRATVNSEAVESAVFAESGERGNRGDSLIVIVLDGSQRYLTIGGLFDVIQQAITGGAEQLSVTYDSEHGYPTKIDIDYQINSIDDEYILTAGAYMPLLAREQDELDQYRALWKQAGSTNYMYEYKILCLCPESGQTISVTVSNGAIESVVYAESSDPLVDPLYYDTIGGLFDEIQDAITYGADRLTVTYSGKYGYPTEIDIDYEVNTYDEELILTISAYMPLP